VGDADIACIPWRNTTHVLTRVSMSVLEEEERGRLHARWQEAWASVAPMEENNCDDPKH